MPFIRLFLRAVHIEVPFPLFSISHKSRAQVRGVVAGASYFPVDFIVENQMELKTLKTIEKEHLQTVLEKTDWDLEKTAQLLKIHVSQVKRKIRLYGLSKGDAK